MVEKKATEKKVVKEKLKETPHKKTVIKESKIDKFNRLAEPRVKGVLKALRIFSNCSNTTNYSYRKEQIDSIFETFEEALFLTQTKFQQNIKQENEFQLIK